MRVVRAHTAAQREAGLALRFRVFVDEQGVSADAERDALDDDASTIHLLVLADDADPSAPDPRDVLGAGRALAPHDGGNPHIGRVAVARGARRAGVGRMLMDALEAEALHAWGTEGGVVVELSAQVQAIPFYEGMGYVVSGEPYLDEGIWHRDAAKRVGP